MSAPKHGPRPVSRDGGPVKPGPATASEDAARVSSDAEAAPDRIDDEVLSDERAPLAEQSREADRPDGCEEPGDSEPLDPVAELQDKADKYLDLAQRTKADFENYRKRAVREAAAARERGAAKLALELLPAVDNLDRALAAVGEGRNGDDLVSGIKLVHADVIAALSRVGIEPFSPEGEPFDPQLHEAVAQHPVEGAEPGTVVEVYQRGYRQGENVLRPAKVVVAG